MNIRYFKRNFSSRTIWFALFFFFNLFGLQTALGQIVLQNDASGINTSNSSKLTVCNDGSGAGILFTDDGGTDGNYADNHTRIDTVEICPTDNGHYVQVVFTLFDIENDDQLEVYQGDLAAVHLGLGVHKIATGVGPANAYGGWVSADCNPSINPSGCLTFIFRTDGQDDYGAGWEAQADCAARAIELRDVTISDAWLSCQDDPFSDITIPTPVVAACDVPLTDASGHVLYEIKNGEGNIIKSDTLTSGASIVKTFAIGAYSIVYTSIVDNSKTLTKQFFVQAPSLVCNDEISKSLDVNCEITLTPADILETVCNAPHLKYNISVTLGTGSTQKTIGPTITITDLEEAGVPLCGGSVRVNIERIYFDDEVPAIVGDCHNGRQMSSCGTMLTFQDLSKPVLNIPTGITEVVACDETGLADILGATATDNCDTDIDITTSIVLAEESPCFGDDGRVAATVTFTATDDCGNSISEDRIFTIIRPTIVEKVADVSIDCMEEATIPVPAMSIGYMDGTTFVRTDSVQLAADEFVCGYILSYTEVAIPTDCGSKLHRYYDLLDWCSPVNGPLPVDTVFVEYTDETAPVLADGAETIGAVNMQLDAFDCTYDINNFAVPTATDNCDSNPTERLDGVFRIENGQLWEITDDAAWASLDCDSFQLRWVAEDNCQDQVVNDTVTQIVVIQDVTAPSVVTVSVLNVSVPDDEDVLVLVDSIDNGSMDACGIKTREIRRMNGDGSYSAWDSVVVLGCEDVSEELRVELRVTDNKNNSSTQWTSIIVEDKIVPVCEDLIDTTFTCLEISIGELGASTDVDVDANFSNSEWVSLDGDLLEVYNTRFGLPNCTDNLSCVNLTYEQEYQLVNLDCGALIAKRRYRAYDSQVGNPSDWAIQNITVNYVSGWTLTFPADVNLTCADGNIPSPSRVTDIVDNGPCDLWVLEVSQDTVNGSNGTCMIIERDYELINWCSYTVGDATIVVPYNLNGATLSHADANSAGRFIYTQLINLSITEAPTVIINEVNTCIVGVGDTPPFGEEDANLGAAPFECDTIRTFSASATNCLGIQLSDFTWKMFIDGVVGGQGAGADFTWIVQPKVEYKVEFWATDDCGNTAVMDKIFEFWDCKRPTPYVLNGLTFDLGSDGLFDVWAYDLDQGSYDNCTDQADLERYIAKGNPTANSVAEVRALGTKVALDCDDLGTQIVSFYLVDAEGNWDVVETYVLVDDNFNVCGGGAMAVGRISGKVTNAFGENVEAVSVSVNGGDNAMTTTSTGQFTFNLPLEGDYTITPEKNINPLNGVSTFDLVLISKHILGLQSFDSPYKCIAADVNKSGSITAFDMVQLRQLILNVTSEFSNNTSWRFVDAKYEFTSENPASENFDEFLNVNNLSGEFLDLNFIGVKIGDVNGTAATNSFAPEPVAAKRNASNEPTEPSFLKLYMDAIPTSKVNDLITVPIKVDNFNRIAAVEFSLEWNPAILEYVGHNVGNPIDGYFGNTEVHNGRLSYLWFDETGNNRSLASATTLYEVQFRLLQSKSTTITFDETDHLPLVVRDNSTVLNINNLASQRFSDPLVASKPILMPGRIIIKTIPIPTMNQWGLFIFGLLILNLGVMGIFYREELTDSTK